MSDFLGNLAARSLGREQVLRPRLAARFEPPAGSAMTPLVEVVDEVTEVSPAPHADRRPPPMAKSVAHRPDALPASAAAPLPQSPQLAPSPRPIQVPVSPPATAVPATTITMTVERPTTPVPTVSPLPLPAIRTTPLQTPTPPRDAVRPAVRAVTDSKSESLPIVPLPVARHDTIGPPHVPMDVGPRQTPAEPPPRMIEPLAPPKAAPVVATMPSKSVRDDEPLPAQAASSPPTIRVTIGRVEVRAVTSPAPAVPTPTAVPMMSLEEYLRHGRRP
jgi:hypothetical protein